MSVVATYTTAFISSASPKTMTVTTQPGDIVVVTGGGESEDGTLNTPSGNGITFTLQQSVVQLNFGTAYVWTGVDATGGTDWTMSITSPGAAFWGATALVVRNSAGVGASTSNNASGTATLPITTTATDSTIAVFISDWNAIDGSSRTWATVNDITPTAGNLLEVAYAFDSSTYTAYSAYYPETGAPGSKTVGITSPTSQKYSIVVLEIFPAVTAKIAWFASAAIPTLRAAAINTANTVSSLGVVIPATTQPGDALVLTVGQASFGATLFNAISGWTKQGEQRAGGAAYTIAIFTRVAQPGDAGTTVTSTSINTENYTGQVRAYYGVDQSTPLDTAVVFAQQDPAATTASAPAITTISSGAAIIAAYGIPTTSGVVLTDADWTTPTGFSNEVTSSTNSGANNAALAMYDMLQGAAGAYGPFSATVTDNRRWAMASVALRPALPPLLSDSFATAGYYGPQWATQPGTISGGRLHLVTLFDYSNVLTSAQTYDFRGRSLSAQVPVVPVEASGEAFLEVKLDDTNRVSIGIGGDSMVLRILLAGVYDDQFVTYNATNHAWWRIKHTAGSNLVEWQTSSDGVTWTTLRSATSGYPAVSAVVVQFFAGYYDAGDSSEPVDLESVTLA